jgi:hypothetical protein
MSICKKISEHTNLSYRSDGLITNYGSSWYFVPTVTGSFLFYTHALATPENYKFSPKLILKMVKLL